MSSNTRPLLSTTTRSERNTDSATSWVIKRIVGRRSCQIRVNSSCKVMRVCASTLANGSSISKTSGLLAKARTTPTRCCMPPDNSLGYLSAACSSPTSDRNSRAIRSHSAFGRPRIRGPKPTFSKTVFHGKRANVWNTTPLSAPGPLTGLSSIMMEPPDGGINPASILSMVVLPHPDGPTIETNSPCLTLSEIS